MVRMAEQVASGDPDDVLVSLGLGSCVGLALLDGRAGVAGLSHIVLPESSPGRPAPPAKFADTAVPALLEELMRVGAQRGRLRAVLCGGAHMFGGRAQRTMLQIGSRNVERTVTELAQRRIPIRAQDTGGSSGRSIEVRVASGEVLVRGVGGATRIL